MAYLSRYVARTAAVLVLALLGWLSAIGADPDMPVPFAVIQKKLAGVRISAGPDALKLTRSPWGPDLYRSTVDSVVLVLVYVPSSSAPGQYVLRGSGSGVLVSVNCHILTNWHVVTDVPSTVIILRPRPPKTFEALTPEDIRVAGVLKTSQPQDLALLQLDPCPLGIKPLPLEDPDRIEVGQDVFAIGHPEGLHWTYTEGVISQIRPRFHWQADGRQFIATMIQTQTPISFGSSGGPLIDRSGSLVGIISNSLAERAGFSFAVSVQELKAFLQR